MAISISGIRSDAPRTVFRPTLAEETAAARTELRAALETARAEVLRTASPAEYAAVVAIAGAIRSAVNFEAGLSEDRRAARLAAAYARY